jgi:hypothetical protein
MIEHTNEMERVAKEGTTYMDCFQGVDLRRTEIVVGIWSVQCLGGQNLMGYFSYFMTQAGMDTRNSFSLSMASSALGIVGTAGSWFLMAKIGRRKIHFGGLCCQCVGDRGNAHRFHLHLRLHGGTGDVLPRVRAVVDSPQSQDDCAGTRCIQCDQHFRQRHDQLPALFVGLELGCARSFLLGWDMSVVLYLGLLPIAGT